MVANIWWICSFFAKEERVFSHIVLSIIVLRLKYITMCMHKSKKSQGDIISLASQNAKRNGKDVPLM